MTDVSNPRWLIPLDAVAMPGSRRDNFLGRYADRRWLNRRACVNADRFKFAWQIAGKFETSIILHDFSFFTFLIRRCSPEHCQCNDDSEPCASRIYREGGEIFIELSL